jgi:hypothetical protein
MFSTLPTNRASASFAAFVRRALVESPGMMRVFDSHSASAEL